jgi:hypothetical protein
MVRIWKCSLMFLLTIAFATAALAAGSPADRAVVILADLDRGLALIPEGTMIPTGITVYAHRLGKVRRAPSDEMKITFDRPLVRAAAVERTDRLVFAYAPVERFAEAYRVLGISPLRIGPPSRFIPLVDDLDTVYYVYFYDGSYHAARKYIQNVLSNEVQYGVQTAVSSAAGDYSSAALEATQGSSQYTYWDATATGSIGSSGGGCITGLYAFQTSDQNFTASVDSSGYITRHYPPICGRYGEPPCTESLTSTMTINFP